jgi:hypothetical protein
MRLVFAAFFTAFAALTLHGCGSEPAVPKKTVVELKDVPPEYLKKAKEKLPDVTFVDAFRKENGHLEIRGKEKTGKIREIGFRPDGTISDIE